MQEVRLHLIDATRGNENEVEDGKKSQLQVKCSITDHPEGEATKQRGEDMQVDLVPHVILTLLELDFR